MTAIVYTVSVFTHSRVSARCEMMSVNVTAQEQPPAVRGKPYGDPLSSRMKRRGLYTGNT